ncbi:outer membrane protein assembly factor BamC [Succinimonas sp.]|uniref:outer membrane protein assembly factor BamC n=1 Tax=Succinimonas sp. TaxID=1936151 RepID=UPI0038695132
MLNKRNVTVSLMLSGMMIMVSALPGCRSSYVNNDIRQANNKFSYLDSVPVERKMVQPEGTTPIDYSKQFDLPEMHFDDVRSALVGKAVDVRPPQKLIPLNSNVSVGQDGDIAYVWFYPDEDGQEITPNDLLVTLFRMFRRSAINVESIDAMNSFIQTDWYDATEFATPYNPDAMEKGFLIYRQRYAFGLRKNTEGAPGVSIQLTDNIIEQTDGTELKAGLNRFEPSRFTALMANRLMWSYNLDMKKKHSSSENAYVAISLGRDNNDLPCWLVDAGFDDTYKALVDLFTAYEIKIKEYSSTAGEITIKYSEPEPEFWESQGVEPWGLEDGKYTFKLGVFQGKTSVTMYDENNKPVNTAVTARMYSGFASSLNVQFYLNRTAGK